jgi:hypothetical protein
VPKLRVPPRLSAPQGNDDLKLAALTRDAAKRLAVSTLTVRRLEGTRLHGRVERRTTFGLPIRLYGTAFSILMVTP